MYVLCIKRVGAMLSFFEITFSGTEPCRAGHEQLVKKHSYRHKSPLCAIGMDVLNLETVIWQRLEPPNSLVGTGFHAQRCCRDGHKHAWPTGYSTKGTKARELRPLGGTHSFLNLTRWGHWHTSIEPTPSRGEVESLQRVTSCCHWYSPALIDRRCIRRTHRCEEKSRSVAPLGPHSKWSL